MKKEKRIINKVFSFCRHRWNQHSKTRNGMRLMYCMRCNKIELHSVKRRYWLSSRVKDDMYCWCPECGNDLNRVGYFASGEDMVLFKCEVCGYESQWIVGAPIPILYKNQEV